MYTVYLIILVTGTVPFPLHLTLLGEEEMVQDLSHLNPVKYACPISGEKKRRQFFRDRYQRHHNYAAPDDFQRHHYGHYDSVVNLPKNL